MAHSLHAYDEPEKWGLSLRSTSPQRETLLSAVLRSKWKLRAALCGIALAAYADSFGLGLTADARTVVTQDRRLHEVRSRKTSA